MLDSIFQINGGTVTIGSLSLTFGLSGIIEIIIFSFVIYYIIAWVKRTKAWSLLKGALVLLIVYLFSKLLGLNNIAYLFEKLVGSLVIAVIVILQPELRRALEQLGKQTDLKGLLPFTDTTKDRGLNSENIDSIVRAVVTLGKNKVGALIVIERSITLNEYIETGIALDAKITTALLEQIFEHNTPLHDGAVVIRNDRIVAATCYLPLSHNQEISKELGTRHRAGLGMSEMTDAIVLIASEETGRISIAFAGNLKSGVTENELRDFLLNSRMGEERKNRKSIFKNSESEERTAE